MLYALKSDRKILATPDHRQATCPTCRAKVIAKCGEKKLKIWHWAHRNSDCDPWSEPESAWHKNWKALFPVDWREVTLENHRCDIKTPEFVIELQHSPIKPTAIEEREAFYGKMLWVFDLRKVAGNLIMPPKNGEGSFTWKWARKSILYCKCPVFIHLGKDQLWNIWNYDPNSSTGLCKKFSKKEFMSSVGALETANGKSIEISSGLISDFQANEIERMAKGKIKKLNIQQRRQKLKDFIARRNAIKERKS